MRRIARPLGLSLALGLILSTTACGKKDDCAGHEDSLCHAQDAKDDPLGRAVTVFPAACQKVLPPVAPTA